MPAAAMILTAATLPLTWILVLVLSVMLRGARLLWPPWVLRPLATEARLALLLRILTAAAIFSAAAPTLLLTRISGDGRFVHRRASQTKRFNIMRLDDMQG